jgi:hypothetical protein
MFRTSAPGRGWGGSCDALGFITNKTSFSRVKFLPQIGGREGRMVHVKSLYNNVLIKYILCSNVYEPPSHLRDGGGCILVGRNTLLKKNFF